ncbi:hypothetical protein FNYG_07043 [Fusarium nygamai]|uniref:Uncharacterized protein n=1 Tax=Gibberella nygamai TaxID=42673 RepID=A0A2K0WBP4_GIBNY|nr:hypothetical protein FNYG_07043 [Fusarium nygamai]
MHAWREKLNDPDAFAVNTTKHKEAFRKLMEHAVSRIDLAIGTPVALLPNEPYPCDHYARDHYPATAMTGSTSTMPMLMGDSTIAGWSVGFTAPSSTAAVTTVPNIFITTTHHLAIMLKTTAVPKAMVPKAMELKATVVMNSQSISIQSLLKSMS